MEKRVKRKLTATRRRRLVIRPARRCSRNRGEASERPVTAPANASAQALVAQPMRLHGRGAEAPPQIGLVVGVTALGPGDAPSSSNARMCVAMRSRNQRSWLMTIAPPAKSRSASSRARSVSTSRSLVGSSVGRLAHERVVGREPRLRLGLPGARRHPHPLELALERAPSRSRQRATRRRSPPEICRTSTSPGGTAHRRIGGTKALVAT